MHSMATKDLMGADRVDKQDYEHALTLFSMGAAKKSPLPVFPFNF